MKWVLYVNTISIDESYISRIIIHVADFALEPYDCEVKTYFKWTQAAMYIADLTLERLSCG